ncbi:MAG: hypothetical protein CYPHOPRED_002267 [Cyphobasidiales sp. Tagirdzhanova-0007]|nr:MAG: hypothetical protein CYPHOPRED_002267 [Cyphobasidiales sp. Tagirdzhanova-0007]
MPLAIPKTATAIVCKEQGDIEVLQLSVVDLRLPGPEEVLVKVEYTGYVFPRYFYSSWRIFERGPHLSCNSVNFIDLYNRNGVYPQALPVIVGNEPAGEVIAIGENVKHLSVGDKCVS